MRNHKLWALTRFADAAQIDWMWLRPYGPGAPPRTLGSFAWVSSIRFVVLPVSSCWCLRLSRAVEVR
eukprot:1873402-Rhodomonas_salina.2